MKRIITILFTFCLCVASISADEINLLRNAYSHPEGNVNNKEEFYNVWNCRYASGELVPSDKLPDSYFNQVAIIESDNYPAYYNGINIDDTAAGLSILPGSASTEMFPAGMPLLLLDYPDQPSFADCCYTIPINVPQAGVYTLTGSIDYNSYLPNAKGYAFNLLQVIFVGCKNPSAGLKEIVVDYNNGVPYLKVSDNDGNVLPCIYLSVFDAHDAAVAFSFNKTIELTPEIKSFAIYAPACRDFFLGGLKLTGEGNFSTISETVEMSETPSRYYDLSGRRIIVGSESLTPGIYIRECGDKVEKVLVR